MTAEGNNPTPQDVESAKPAVEQPGSVSEAAKKPDEAPVDKEGADAVKAAAQKLENEDAAKKQPVEVIAEAAGIKNKDSESKSENPLDSLKELFEGMGAGELIAVVMISGLAGLPPDFALMAYRYLKERRNAGKTKEAQQAAQTFEKEKDMPVTTPTESADEDPASKAA